MGAGRNPALGAEGGQKEATATGGEGRRDRQTQGGSKATRPQKSFLWNWKDLGLVPGDRRAEEGSGCRAAAFPWSWWDTGGGFCSLSKGAV